MVAQESYSRLHDGDRKSISQRFAKARKKVMKLSLPKVFRKQLAEMQENDKEEENMQGQVSHSELDVIDVFTLPVEIDNDDCPGTLLRSPSLTEPSADEDEGQGSTKANQADDDEVEADEGTERQIVFKITIDENTHESAKVVKENHPAEDESSETTDEDMTDDSTTEEDNLVQDGDTLVLEDTKSNDTEHFTTREVPMWHALVCGAITLPTEKCGNWNCSGIKRVDDPEAVSDLIEIVEVGSESLAWLGSPVDNLDEADDISMGTNLPHAGRTLESPSNKEVSNLPAGDTQELSTRAQEHSSLETTSSPAKLKTRPKDNATALSPEELAKRQWHKNYLRVSAQRLLEEQENAKNDKTTTAELNPFQSPPHGNSLEIDSARTEEAVQEDQEVEYLETQEPPPELLARGDDLCIATSDATESAKQRVHEDIEDVFFHASFPDTLLETINEHQEHTGASNESLCSGVVSEQKEKVEIIEASVSFDSESYLVGEKLLDCESDCVSVGRIVRDLQELQDLQRPLKIAEAKFNPPSPPPLPPLPMSKSAKQPPPPSHPPSPKPAPNQMLNKNHPNKDNLEEQDNQDRYAVEEESSVAVNSLPYSVVGEFARMVKKNEDSALAHREASRAQGRKESNERQDPPGFIAAHAQDEESDLETQMLPMALFVAHDETSDTGYPQPIFYEGSSDRETAEPTDDHQKAGIVRGQSTPDDDSIFEGTESKASLVRGSGRNTGALDNQANLLHSKGPPPCEEIIVNNAIVRVMEDSSLKLNPAKRVAFDFNRYNLSTGSVCSQSLSVTTYRQDMFYGCVGENVTTAIIKEMDKYIDDYGGLSAASSFDDDSFDRLMDAYTY